MIPMMKDLEKIDAIINGNLGEGSLSELTKLKIVAYSGWYTAYNNTLLLEAIYEHITGEAFDDDEE